MTPRLASSAWLRSPNALFPRCGGTTSTRDPKSWVLLGNDTGPDADESSDSEWTVLDARNDEGPFAERSTLYTFDVTTPGSFKFYRLKITATHGDPQVDIVEIELYATPGVNAIDGVRATGFPRAFRSGMKARTRRSTRTPIPSTTPPIRPLGFSTSSGR